MSATASVLTAYGLYVRAEDLEIDDTEVSGNGGPNALRLLDNGPGSGTITNSVFEHCVGVTSGCWTVQVVGSEIHMQVPIAHMPAVKDIQAVLGLYFFDLANKKRHLIQRHAGI